jgi:hypothetical protein
MQGVEVTVNNEPIDSLLADYRRPEDLIGEHGLLTSNSPGNW